MDPKKDRLAAMVSDHWFSFEGALRGDKRRYPLQAFLSFAAAVRLTRSPSGLQAGWLVAFAVGIESAEKQALQPVHFVQNLSRHALPLFAERSRA